MHSVKSWKECQLVNCLGEVRPEKDTFLEIGHDFGNGYEEIIPISRNVEAFLVFLCLLNLTRLHSELNKEIAELFHKRWHNTFQMFELFFS